MDKPTLELFLLINEAIAKFESKHPLINKNEIFFNAVAMFSGTLINTITKGKDLEEKLKVLDDLIQKEKDWIKYQHQKEH